MENYLPATNGNNPFDIFDYKNLGSVRAYVDQQDEKWFCLGDVCDILCIKEYSRAASRLDPKGVRLTQVLTNGGPQNVNFINLGNLFRLITRSRKPEAQEFTNWVCDVVLPQLMNKGYYVMNNTNTNGGMIQALKNMVNCLEDHEQKLTNHQQLLNTYGEQISDQQKINENFERTIKVLETEGFYTVSGFAKFTNVPLTLELAKEIGIIATNLANDQGISVGCMTHPIYGHINLYPFAIISQAYQMCSYNNN